MVTSDTGANIGLSVKTPVVAGTISPTCPYEIADHLLVITIDPEGQDSFDVYHIKSITLFGSR